MFDSSLSEKSLNLERETREENRGGDEIPGLKNSQLRQKYEEENRCLEDWNLPSEGRLITLYNSRKGNPSLLE